jgi:NADPH:quinone reductase-like Zn-dependent oxidoreductase
MLAVRARLAAGETLLVQGAGSGVGTAAIQIARYLGARVLAATHSPAKVAALRALGADEVLVPGRERLHQRVQKLTGRRGADVVFEHVGAATWDESVRSAAFRGRIVTCGATTGVLAQTNLAFVFAKELTIHGVTLGSREDLATVLDLVQQGRLQPVVDRVLPLAACRAGHEILEAGGANGKIVLAVSPT